MPGEGPRESWEGGRPSPAASCTLQGPQMRCSTWHLASAAHCVNQTHQLMLQGFLVDNRLLSGHHCHHYHRWNHKPRRP